MLRCAVTQVERKSGVCDTAKQVNLSLNFGTDYAGFFREVYLSLNFGADYACLPGLWKTSGDRATPALTESQAFVTRHNKSILMEQI